MLHDAIAIAPLPLDAAVSPAIVDLRESAFRDDPHRILRPLRERGPLHRDTLGVWLVTGHALARAVLTDTHMGRDPRQWRGYASLRPYLADSTLEQTVERWMLLNDGSAHTRMRRLAAGAFTPAATRLLEQQVTATADALIDALPKDRPFDLMRDFAQPFPVRVMGDLLGLPAGDFDRSKAWSDALAMVVEPAATRAVREQSDRAAAEMLDYLCGVVASRRHHPRDDLLSDMLARQACDRTATDDELLANLMLLFVAGHETTTNLIGNGMLSLMSHPLQLARLRAEPSLMPQAVEEMMRFEGPVSVVARIAHQSCRVGDLTIAPGDLLYCLTAAANRDPKVFLDPDAFDVGRERNPHLSFGGGVHYCLGAPLARLEGAVAFRRLLARFAHLRRTDSDVAWRPLVNLRGLTRLDVTG